ncbi:MAG: hypothetical protein K0Q73_8931, partial [Paenibacillus sp.]|nr:hypothetical protein [Paenibacillus sp.]
MATFQQVLIEALKRGQTTLTSVNRNLMTVSSSTKRKPGYIQVAMNDDVTKGYLMSKNAGFVVTIDGDLLNEI